MSERQTFLVQRTVLSLTDEKQWDSIQCHAIFLFIFLLQIIL